MLGHFGALAIFKLLYYIMSEKKENWEVKDRVYELLHKKPLTYTMSGKHSSKRPLMYFDESKGHQRELRYATNQKSPFVDEQKGSATLGHIVFEEGVLFVPKEQQNLQKLLSIYHPKNGKVYKEQDSEMDAVDDLEYFNYESQALNLALEMEIDHCEAVLRVEIGSKVSNMSSKEIRRDTVLFARDNPQLFLELAEDDNIQVRNLGIAATEAGVIKLSDDQRTFKWGSNGRKLMTVPFDENPYSALAEWFKTDEGVDVFKSIEKKLK
jgi:hypothetical protein